MGSLYYVGSLYPMFGQTVFARFCVTLHRDNLNSLFAFLITVINDLVGFN